MLSIEFLARKNGSVLKKAGEYADVKVIGVYGGASTVIATLLNSEGVDVTNKYTVDGTPTLPQGEFIRADKTDKWFTKVKFTGTAVFVLG